MYVYGYIKFFKETTFSEKDQLAFEIMGKAVETKIGMKFGGNTKSIKYIQDLSADDRKKLFAFEMMETLNDIDADTLLLGDGKTYGSVTPESSLEQRMTLIKTMLQHMLSSEISENIFLMIDGDFDGDGDIHHIAIHEFVPFIINQYEINDNFEPTINLLITRN